MTDTSTGTGFFWLPSLAQTPATRAGQDLDREHHQRAVAWLLSEHARLGVNPVVVASTRRVLEHQPHYRDFQHHTPNTRTRLEPGAAVLALFPTAETLREAETIATGTALCVFGGSKSGPRLDYWIQDRDAQPLSSFLPDFLAPLDANVVGQLEGAVEFGGVNGFSSPDEKAEARQAIDTIASITARPTPQQIEAYLLSHPDVSHHGVKWFHDEYVRRTSTRR